MEFILYALYYTQLLMQFLAHQLAEFLCEGLLSEVSKGMGVSRFSL
jgi:hypothetical protein